MVAMQARGRIQKCYTPFTFGKRPGLAVNKPKQPKMQHNFRTMPTQHHANHRDLRGSVDRRIRAFLSGETHGEDVLHALYGSVADEPIPERLRAILKR